LLKRRVGAILLTVFSGLVLRPSPAADQLYYVVAVKGVGPLYERFQCAAVPIGTDVVLTAGHCLHEQNAELEIAAVLRGDLCQGAVASAVDVLSAEALPSDIAVLTVARPIGGYGVRAMTLSDSTFIVDGWSAGGTRPCRPVRKQLRRVPLSLCQPLLPGRGDICAVAQAGSLNTCRGDSGAPLLVADGTALALTSRGLGCRPGDPGLYSAIQGVG
jgi:hypothetical protein